MYTGARTPTQCTLLLGVVCPINWKLQQISGYLEWQDGRTECGARPYGEFSRRDGTKEGRILREVSKGMGSSATSLVKDSPPGSPEPLVDFYHCRQGRELCSLIVLCNHLRGSATSLTIIEILGLTVT
jgi:hypothetical protein